MAESQFSTLWWEPCIWCNTCGGRYGVREYQRFCIIPAAGPTHQLSLIFFTSISIISLSDPSPFSLFSLPFFLSTLPSSPLLCTRARTVHRLVASLCMCVSICEAKSRSGGFGVGFVFASRWACHNRIEYFRGPWHSIGPPVPLSSLFT